jgi:toll-like receptor 13
MGFVALVVLVHKSLTLNIAPDSGWDPCNIPVEAKPVENNMYYRPPSCVDFVPESGYSGGEKLSLDYIFYQRKCWCTVCKLQKDSKVNDYGYARCECDGVYFMGTPILPSFVQVLDWSYNSIENVYNVMLENVLHLNITSLILAGNRIQSLGALVNMSTLTCVNLDRNGRLLTEEILQQLLALPNLQRLSLRKSIIRPVDGSWLDDSNSQKLYPSMILTPSLEQLWLEGSFPHCVGTDSDRRLRSLLVRFPNLTGLSLSGSNIDNVDYVLMDKLKYLRYLDLSNNNIVAEVRIMSQRHQIASIDLSNNKIDEVFYLTQLPIYLKHLNASANILADFRRAKWYPLDCSKMLPNLEYLSVDDQRVSTLHVDADLFNHPSLTELRINTKLDKHISYRDYRKYENVSKDNNVLQHLYADGSDLALMSEVQFLDLFGHLKAIKTLSLAHSQIDFVSPAMFANFVNLTTLLLRENSISVLPDGVFNLLTQLKHLDLSGNKLTVVSEQTFSVQMQKEIAVLDLGQNPFVCACSLVWFRQWYVWNRNIFNVTRHDFDYSCRDKHLKFTFDEFHLGQQACMLSPEISGNIIFFCTVFVTSFTAFLLLIRYRWHLRLMLYEAFRGRDDVRRRYLQQGHFKYDVFVSYAKENLPWVRQNLMAELEGRLGLSLCIHERDFVPGNNIVDNIADCVSSSKKVMMVFSRHFKRSQWCQFELAYCLTHVMDYDDALIIISLDDLTSYELTSSMMAVLKTTTYIQWDRHPDAVRSFWGRLKQALHEVFEFPGLMNEELFV